MSGRPEPEETEPPAAAAEPTSAETAPAPPAEPTPKRRRARRTAASEEKKPSEKEPEPSAEAPKAPRRPTLEPELRRLLSERDRSDERRPRFVRQQSHRYLALRRPVTWRRPRGQQSKQRRHYGYRPTVVSIGFRSPRRTRGLTASGFRPVLVRTPADVAGLDPARDAALVARTVGTRLRLVIEESARLRGVHVLNPLVREPRGE